MVKIAISYVVHDDAYYLAESIRSFCRAGDVFVFISRLPWNDQPGDWEAAAEVARNAGAEVIVGDWDFEPDHRQAAWAHLREQGYTHALTPDGDEIVDPHLLQTLLKIADGELADRVYVHMDTYWKSPEYVIRPRETLTPILMVDLRKVTPYGIRLFEGGRALYFPPEYGVLHHLSYAGPDARILRKIATWSHQNEVQAQWLENVWHRWNTDTLLRNLHPTHPPFYGFAERIHVPDVLQPAMARYKALSGSDDVTNAPLVRPAVWPDVSIIIPLHGGEIDIRLCLDSLAKCQNLFKEMIVVDNASPDTAASVVREYPWVTLLENETNAGFAAACNQGAAQAKGDVLLFLNSDTVMPPAGLIRLIEALMQSGSIAASGPYTNRAGHFQQIEPTYTSLDTLDLFAEDFAQRLGPDHNTDMLVGFCLAVRRTIWEEVGGFDERFGLGMFEDNDLCYRLRRVGYRLVIASRAFVHHKGSQTLRRLQADTRDLFLRNQKLYVQKWRADIECGYASQLAGMGADAITFDLARHPALREQQIKRLAERADISLCMIVRDEERVLRDALASARPFFTEMILVDTGSTDATREIACELGARVIEFPWTDSFAAARNESLRHARGKWIFWMDADDTLPWQCGEALLTAALNAKKEIAGFVVPVQFVESDGSPNGTRVDHVKLFRNLPGLAFEGRIHEQILGSLRQAGGEIARSEAYVLHSGYDTSPEGQAKKRKRDAKLLRLDLEERPDHPFVLFNLGMTHHYSGEHAEAISWLRKSLDVAPSTDSHVRKAYALLAMSLRETNKPYEAYEAILQGLEAAPGDPELLFQAGALLTAQNRLEEAKQSYLQVLEASISEHFSSIDMGILGTKTYHNLGSLYQQTGGYQKAREWWLKALAASPRFTPSIQELFKAALQAGDLNIAQQLLQRVQKMEGTGEQWATMSAQYAEGLGGPPQAHQFLVTALQNDPANPALRMVFARRLLLEGREREAQEHLRLLDQAGSAEAAYFRGVFALRQEKKEEALAHLERALERNPAHLETRSYVAQLKAQQGSPRVA